MDKSWIINMKNKVIYLILFFFGKCNRIIGWIGDCQMNVLVKNQVYY